MSAPFLLNQSDRINAGWPGSAERRAQPSRSSTCIAALDQWTVLRVSGNDRDAFLQGQLTNDLRQLSPERTLAAACCNAQGRVLAIMRASRLATHTLLRLHSSLAEAMLTRLQRFVLRADVRIDAPGDALAAIGVWGPGAVQLLQQARLPAPDAAEACAAQGSVQVTRQPSAVPRFELRGPRTALTVPWNLIAEHATRVGSNAWRLLDILEGLPDISAPTSGHFLAQSLNLDLSGAIHFDKGCYSGQEIIARLHYRGRAARRMYLLRAKGPPPAPGDPVHHLREAAAIGEVVDAAEEGDGSCAIAAVLRIPHADDGLYLPAAPRRALTPPTPFTYARSAALSS